MFNYYDIEIIPIILNRFKVRNIVVCGDLEEKTLNQILGYCKNNIQQISKGHNLDFDNYSLNVLPNLSNYDAIFINDDSNWYTVYNELKIINDKNEEFPLVFICNNVFPYKRRDAYLNPELVPIKFRNNYSKELFYCGKSISDGLFHAIDENTPNNGVLTAIEDFLFENKSVDLMNIKLINGITILYPKSRVSQRRLSKLDEELLGYDLKNEMLFDNLIETQFLKNYLGEFDEGNIGNDEILKYELQLEEKEKIIEDYKDKVRLHDNELSYKDSQINSVNSKLSLRNAQIKNLESKLINSEIEISNLTDELQIANAQLISLKDEINQEKKDFKKNKLNFDNQISDANSLIDSLKGDLSKKEKIESELTEKLHNANIQIKNNDEQLVTDEIKLFKKDNQIKSTQNELKEIKNTLISIKNQYTAHLLDIDKNKYCISCYEEKISDNVLEIDYLKNNAVIRKILNPFSYLVLILKSNPKEVSLDIKLYKVLKNSKCFDIGFYLRNNGDIMQSNWCKYFSPELHYVCNGFNEKRKFNKKYFNRNSKKELLEYILKCQ